MKKTDKFAPVITITVYYFGEKPWDGASSLHGMLEIPEKMKRFVNDYKMLQQIRIPAFSGTAIDSYCFHHVTSSYQ